jgi:hypothetical protein
MKPVAFRYFAPPTVDDALDLLATHGDEGLPAKHERAAPGALDFFHEVAWRLAFNPAALAHTIASGRRRR